MYWGDSIQSSSLKAVKAVVVPKSFVWVLLTPPTSSLSAAAANDASDLGLIISFPAILLWWYSSWGFCTIYQSLSMISHMSVLACATWNNFPVLYLNRLAEAERDKDKRDA